MQQICETNLNPLQNLRKEILLTHMKFLNAWIPIVMIGICN